MVGWFVGWFAYHAFDFCGIKINFGKYNIYQKSIIHEVEGVMCMHACIWLTCQCMYTYHSSELNDCLHPTQC